MYANILLNLENKSRFIKRYIKFIDWCRIRNLNLDSTIIVEKHHILPVGEFIQYKDFKLYKWNLIKLTLKQHFIAHYMLAKIFGSSQWYAFNQMRRIGKTSILYSYCKTEISEELKYINLGRTHSEETKLKYSKLRKNKVVVKDSSNNIFQTTTDDPKYLSGELVFYRLGYKHKDSTKNKMSSNNGRKGKKPFIAEDGNMIFLKPEDGNKLGLIEGCSEEYKKNMSKTISDLIWVTDKITGKITRIRSYLFNPDIYIKGRKGYKGWSKINEKRRKDNGL